MEMAHYMVGVMRLTLHGLKLYPDGAMVAPADVGMIFAGIYV